MSVRVRFAPSPTGYLHIGGVRTALFNWLFARRHGGQFILRIDDTDQQRNVEEALKPILDGFRWLDIDWDEGPLFQSQRLTRYREAAQALLDKGLAYVDFAAPEEIQAERDAAQAQKRPFVYSRRWMADTPEKKDRWTREGRSGVVRLMMPREGECRFRDLVRGNVSFDWSQEQDHVIQRADGSSLYHLASVVDDHDMKITHVIRAEEHLSNTPRQLFIGRGLGSDPPQFAHLPTVAEPGSRNKLSKRKLDTYLKNPAFARMYEHGRAIAESMGRTVSPERFNPVIIDFYATVGYTPAAILNYLLLLGWSLDDRTEFFTREEMIGQFSLERVNKSPASFDPDKLSAFQDRYMRQVSVEQKAEMMTPYLERAGIRPSPEVVAQILRAAGDRIKVAGDILDYRDFFTPDVELAFDEKAFHKRLRKPAEVPGLLRDYRDALAGATFDTASLEASMKAFIERKGIKLGKIIHAVRVAVTGKPVGFGLYEAMEILGKERCLARIDRALSLL